MTDKLFAILFTLEFFQVVAIIMLISIIYELIRRNRI